FSSSVIFHTFVPEPMSCPLYFPFIIGPPGTTIVGRTTLAAPLMVQGGGRAQPVSNTTPSIGLPRIDSSASILARLRKSIAVGFNKVSPNDMIGNSNGKLHDSYT